MKKKIILFLCFLVGLLSLTGCDDSANISYVDSNGETQTLKVTATDDQEVVNKVVDYAIKANYDDFNNYLFAVAADFKATFNKNFSSLLGEELGDLKGSFDLDFNVVENEGLDASLDFDMSLGKSYNARLNAECIYNGSINEINEESYLYVKGLYYEKTDLSESTETIKNAYKLMSFINDFIPDDNDVSISPKDFIDLNDLIEEINPKFIVSSVKSGIIYLDTTISLKDLLNCLEDVNIEEIEEIINLLGSADIKVTLSYGLEAETGRFKKFNFSYIDTNFVNTLISGALNLPNVKMLDEFEINFTVSLEPNKAKIKKLSDDEKAGYTVSDDDFF